MVPELLFYWNTVSYESLYIGISSIMGVGSHNGIGCRLLRQDLFVISAFDFIKVHCSDMIDILRNELISGVTKRYEKADIWHQPDNRWPQDI